MNEQSLLLGCLVAGCTLTLLGLGVSFFRSWRRERAVLEGYGAWAQTFVDPAPIVTTHRPEPTPDDTTVLFALRNISKTYREPNGQDIRVLRDFSITLHKGMTGLVGDNGRGKSTLVHFLAGIDTPDQGTIAFQGWEMPRRQNGELRRYRAESVSVIFQDLNLVTHQSALDNVILPLQLRGVPRSKALVIGQEALTHLGIGELAHRRPFQLSGGQRQRVAIARAFASGAPVLLCDEPTGALDPETADLVMRSLARLTLSHQLSVIVVTHNHTLAKRYCDHVLEFTPEGLVEMDRSDLPHGELVSERQD